MPQRSDQQISSKQQQAADDRQRTEPQVWQICYLSAVGALGTFFLLALYSGDTINVALKLIFLALLILTLKRWTGALLLALMQVNLFYLEQSEFEAMSGLTSALWVATTVGLLIVVSRYRTLQDQNRKSALTDLPQLLTTFAAGHSPEARRISTNLQSIRQNLFRVSVVLIGCALAAAFLLRMVPLHQRNARFDTVREFGLYPPGYRVLMMGMLLFVLFLPTWLMVNEVVWRRSSRRQARLYLRSVFLKWIHRDLRMVVNKRIKRRRARIRAIKRAEPKNVNVESEGEL